MSNSEEITLTIERFPDIRTEWDTELGEIAQYMENSVIQAMAQGGNPPWERTKHGAIPRLYDRFAHTVRSEVDVNNERVDIFVGEGLPDTALHHFGGDVFQVVTEKQRGFFWAMFYETDDDMWKFMALSKSLLSHHPERTLMAFQEEDVDTINGVFAESLFVYSETEQKYKTLTGGHA